MEAHAALLLVKEEWKHGSYIKQIVCDDDTSVRSNVKHSWRELIREGKMDQKEWPKTQKNYRKTDYGQLPLHIPEPIFLADPTHCIKVFAKHLFKLVKAQGSQYGKIEVLRMKRYMGCWLKKNENKFI